MVALAQPLAAPAIAAAAGWELGAVTVLATTPSTQDLARQFVATHRLSGPRAWLAEEQTAGYGRRQRHFYSPAQAGLYFTLAVPAATRVKQPGLLTTGVAEAIFQVLKAQAPDLPLSFKWVNDLYCQGKKVAGILVEQASDAAGMPVVVVGCGINLTPVALPADLQARVGALNLVADRNQLAGSLLPAIAARVGDYHRGAFLPTYRAHSLVLGRPVTLRLAGTILCGKAVAIDDAGGLVVATPKGERTVTSGEVVKVEW